MMMTDSPTQWQDMTRSKDLNHFFKGLVTAGDEGGKWHDGAHRKHLNQGKIYTE